MAEFSLIEFLSIVFSSFVLGSICTLGLGRLAEKRGPSVVSLFGVLLWVVGLLCVAFLLV
jgi:hypothetical protein